MVRILTAMVCHPNGMEIIQPKVARNELPWVSVPTVNNPERVESIPHIPFIKRHFVSLQKFPKLLLKRNFAMMLLLSGDIIPHRFHLRIADGENAVAILPREIVQVGAFSFQPERRAAFDFFDHFCRLAGARQRRENVNMVFHAADDDGLAIEVGQNAAEVTV